MKQQIRPSKSIRKHVVVLLVMFTILMTVFLSLQSARNFLRGFDIVNAGLLVQLANEFELDGDRPREVLKFHIAASWNDVPDEIKKRFPHGAEKANRLYKRFENWAYLAPPGRSYILMRVVNSQQKMRYVSRIRLRNDLPQANKGADHTIPLDPMVQILLWAVGVILLFFLILQIVLRSIAMPVEALLDWSESLTINKLDQSIPDFRYQELNHLANIVHGSLTTVGAALKEEQEFLAYASHELRTPIAILRSNSGLLEKVSPNPSEKERSVRDRINRASLTMKGMTETLLWLSRDGDMPISYETVDLERMIQQIIAEIDYLLLGKLINVDLQTETVKINLPREAARILLTNLIRNAFQHTESGEIVIRQNGCEVSITNTVFTAYKAYAPQQTTGFGLGLKLSRKLASQLGWLLQEDCRVGSLEVKVKLSEVYPGIA